MRRRLGLTVAAALALGITLQPAWAQRPDPELPVFGHTLHQGSGYIATPHAFVSEGALFVTATAIAPDDHIAFVGAPPGSYTVTRAAVGLALNGWIEVGGTVHTADAYSFFGKLQMVRQTGVFPALAVGIHNLTTVDLGRYGIEDPFYNDFWEASSIYAVFTYVAGPGDTPFPSFVTITGGWGTGIFGEDNPQIEDEGSAGLFGAVSLDFQAGNDAFLRFVGEWDGFDINVAAVAWLAGLEFTVGALSIGKGDAPAAPLVPSADPTLTFAGQFYNQVKPFVSLTLDFRALGVIPWIWTQDEE